MRPDLTDLLGGIQRLLQGEIVPALADPFLQEQVTYAGLLLEYAKNAWAREHLAIATEHADLAACVSAVAAHVEALEGPEVRALAADFRAALEAHGAVSLPVAETSLDRLLAVDRERRALLERALALVGSIDAVREVIDAYLVGAADRRQAVLTTLGLNW